MTMKCKDSAGVIRNVTWRIFKANCPKLNQICSGQSEAYVAAITVCNQSLF